MKKKIKIVVLYHKNCGDGFGSAWAAWKCFGARAKYIAVTHQEPPPRAIQGAELFICDFSYPLPVMKRIRASARRVVALDHHASARVAIKIAHEYRYDLRHSGAAIAWRYFHPKKKMPLLLRYIEDADLWAWELPRAREVVAYVNAHPFDFVAWDRFERALRDRAKRADILKEGSAIVRYEKRIIERAVSVAQLVRFCGSRIYAANSNTLTSEIGNALIAKKPPMGIVWSERDGFVVVSLRSNGAVDVSKIAVKYGGGGHKRAAGFSFSSRKPKPWKVLD